jgi:hypothetical protein
MKKKFLLICMAAVCHCHAQKFHVSVIAGANSFKTSVKDYRSRDVIDLYPNAVTFSESKVDPGYSFFGGLKFDFDLTTNLSLSSKLLLDHSRFTEHFERFFGNDWWLDSAFGQDKVRLLYISVPLHFVFYASTKKFRIYIGTGGYINYGLLGTNEYKSFYSSVPWYTDSISQVAFNKSKKLRSVSYRANRFDYGLSVMTGIHLRNGFFIEAGFENGLNSIFQDRYPLYGVAGASDRNEILYNIRNKRKEFKLGIGYRIK